MSRAKSTVSVRKKYHQPQEHTEKIKSKDASLSPEQDEIAVNFRKSTNPKGEITPKLTILKSTDEDITTEAVDISNMSGVTVNVGYSENQEEKERTKTKPSFKELSSNNLLKPTSKPKENMEGDISSDDSSSHSGSDGQSTLGRSSKTGSDETQSIAVDCHTGPSEVIVKGKNVRKIRVKFPHPPTEELSTYERTPFSGGRFRRQPSGLSLSSGQSPQEHGDDYEYNPLNQNDLIKPVQYSGSLPPALPDIPRSTSFTSSYRSQNGQSREQGVSAMSLDLGLQYGAYDLDSKIKHDIINGIEYFERKNAEMKEINNKVLKELERISRLNNHLEDSLKLADERNKMLSVENDELKIKLDQKEKESDKLKTQAMSQWNTRVKTEEMYIELKRDNEAEIKTLKEQLESKEKDIARIISSNKDKSMQRKTHGDGHQTFNKSLKTNIDDNFELLHKIARLEDEITKMKCEKDKFLDHGKRSKDEVDGMKGRLKDQHSELETQHKRFLSLKKSFNDLMDENEKLKSQLHVRSTKKNATAININNNTWPKNIQGDKKSETSDGVSYFGLPSKIGKSQGSKKTVKPAFEHSRIPSDGRIPENLPPVPSPVK